LTYILKEVSEGVMLILSLILIYGWEKSTLSRVSPDVTLICYVEIMTF